MKMYIFKRGGPWLLVHLNLYNNQYYCLRSTYIYIVFLSWQFTYAAYTIE